VCIRLTGLSLLFGIFFCFKVNFFDTMKSPQEKEEILVLYLNVLQSLKLRRVCNVN
jgi:hypothetical protein